MPSHVGHEEGAFAKATCHGQGVQCSSVISSEAREEAQICTAVDASSAGGATG